MKELRHILSLTRPLVSLRTREFRLRTAERREDLVLRDTLLFLGIGHELVTLRWDGDFGVLRGWQGSRVAGHTVRHHESCVRVSNVVFFPLDTAI